MEELLVVEQFVDAPTELQEQLMAQVTWDERLASRKTASFGKAYNYEPVHYAEQDFSPCLQKLLPRLEATLGFLPVGSLLYMSNALQEHWQHALPKSKTEEPRLSLSFRLLTPVKHSLM